MASSLTSFCYTTITVTQVLVFHEIPWDLCFHDTTYFICVIYMRSVLINIQHDSGVSECKSGPSQAGGWGGFSPPVFGQTVNPISTRGADYTHRSTTSPFGFLDLATGLYIIVPNPSATLIIGLK